MTSRASILALLELTVLVTVSCGGALWWRSPSSLEWGEAARLIGHTLMPLACLASAFYYTDLYDFRAARSFAEFCARLPKSLSVAVIFTAVLYAVFPRLGPGFPSFPGGIGGLVEAVVISLGFRAVLYTITKTSAFAERVLILGAGPLAWKIMEEMAAASPVTGEILGFVADSDAPYRKFAAVKRPVLGTLVQLERIVRETRPDRIIVALSERRGRLPVRVLLEARMRGILVEDGVEVHERLTGKLAIESLSPSFLIFSKEFKKSRIQMTLRRAVSLVVALGGILGSSFLMLMIAVAIKLDSVGPVFFMQERAGVSGRSFRLIKFRTMRPETNERSAWEEDNRYRITRVGKWLRRFRLDELPQFFNVLRGDMNLVGPRPHPVSNYNFFMENIPYYSLRSAVRPGMTGWAQVCYSYANNLEEETEKMRYDLFYIKNLSLWLDLRIILDTIKTVLFGHKETEQTSARQAVDMTVAGGMTVSMPKKKSTERDVHSALVGETAQAVNPLDVLHRSA